MTFYHGLGMFIFNMFALIIGGTIAYYIINKVEKEKKRKEKLKYMKGEIWEKDDTE
tara:strand:+ start:254 stop:421 length:168 start_codon:yes stop_codon:yes gene_type:complete